MYPNHLDMS